MRTVLCLSIALCLLTLTACSKARVTVQTPPLPASLSQPCQALAPLPDPMIDPARLIWELDAINAYADCAARHRATVEAWPKG